MPTFVDTHWSGVRAMHANDPRQVARAFEVLCRDYMQPCRVWLRSNGVDEGDAEELVQAFFARLIEKRDLDARCCHGRFRDYLLGALRNFVSNESRLERARKRGGEMRRVTIESLDPLLVDASTPSHAFERSWALTILERARSDLEAEYRARDREELFTTLQPMLAGRPEPSTYQDLADRWGVGVSAVKVAVHRLRGRMRELVRAAIRDTLASDGCGPSEADIDEEVAALFVALSGK
ncbi:MAG: sigma-70 family RNA polymerase sigma factor [Planctomycetes bacterium]|nr:sigma-70 family RNA polymerase sigma factor [Planctomycetota bacterium]MCB9892604.1 sigma-70 family RNA polymerase sigma factor [Planctomycetota bacterium]MCB9917875.1 sigma-70 family RNA polymerase sigma factor [Planctomycetota bacterium]